MRFAQPIAAWLVARPLHAVLGLAFTLLIPAFGQIVSGAAMTAIVLHHGWRTSMLYGLTAVVLVGAMVFVAAGPVQTIGLFALAYWLPASAVAVLLVRTRSLTLAMQVVAILALAGTLLIHAGLADPAAFWEQVLDEVAAGFRERGFGQYADLLVSQQDVLARQMTAVFVLMVWLQFVFALALGYGLFQALPDNRARFGRFCDLNFGRVLATVAAAASLLAWLVGAEWLASLAYVSFAVFWLQGMALVHWLHTDGPLPVAAVVLVYVMLPIVGELLVVGLALAGYSDAWLDFRARLRRGMPPQ